MNLLNELLEKLAPILDESMKSTVTNGFGGLETFGYTKHKQNIDDVLDLYDRREVGLNEVNEVTITELTFGINEVFGLLGVIIGSSELLSNKVIVLDTIVNLKDIDDPSELDEVKLILLEIDSVLALQHIIGLYNPLVTVDIIDVRDSAIVYIETLLDKNVDDFKDMVRFAKLKSVYSQLVNSEDNSLLKALYVGSGYKQLLLRSNTFLLTDDVEDIRQRLIALYLFGRGDDTQEQFINVVSAYVDENILPTVLKKLREDLTFIDNKL